MRRHLPPAPPFNAQAWGAWLTRLQTAAGKL
jgi:hypothetical protein